MASAAHRIEVEAAAPVVQLFSNPAAGSHSAARLARLVAAFEAAGADVIRTECRGALSIDPRATHVCIAGGDGTVRHVAAAASRMACPVPMSIFPMGTINLLAREAGYPADPEGFAATVLAGSAGRPHFPVELDEGFFFACAGVGPDSHAVAAVSGRLKRRIGRLAYVAAFLKVLWRWPRHEILLRADDTEIRCEAFYVAKGRYYAGPWSLSRSARVDDPAMHLVALPRARRRDYLRFVTGLAMGRDAARQTQPIVLSCTSLSASSAADLPLQADGDIVGSLPVSMKVGLRPISFC